jgi:hypothetical protein
MSKTKIVPVLGVIVCIAAGMLWMVYIYPLNSYMAKNCPQYKFTAGFVDPKEFIDCRNYIGVERYLNESHLTIFNQKFLELRNWSSFSVHDYKIVDDQLYYIEDPALNVGQWTYFSATELPGSDPISLFRVINTQTSGISIYSSYEEMPQSARAVFEELEKK